MSNVEEDFRAASLEGDRDPLRELQKRWPELNRSERQRWLNALRSVPQPEVLTTLLTWANELPTGDVRRDDVLESIAKIGSFAAMRQPSMLDDPDVQEEEAQQIAQDTEQMSQILIGALNRATPGDPDLAAALVRSSMAIGAPFAVEQVMKVLEAAGSQPGPLQDILASQALVVHNPAAVPVLEAYLTRDAALQTKIARHAGEILSLMGQPEATDALLRWAAPSDAGLLPIALEWLGRIRDSESLPLLESRLSTLEFQEPQTRAGLLEIARKRRAELEQQ